MRRTLLVLSAATLFSLGACNSMPTVGPSQREITAAAQDSQGVQVIDVDAAVVHRLREQRTQQQFSEALGTSVGGDLTIGAGDALQINLWESPPAALFGGSAAEVQGAPSTAKAVTLPEQIVDREGYITVPFAGRIKVAALSPRAVEQEIVQRLDGKANQPQAMVRVLRNASSNVTVVGEVATSLRMPLTDSGERVLDALAAAGGVRQPVNKMTLQITRGNQYVAMPLDLVIRDPKQNVPLQAGDVVTAIFQPLSFTALGATGKNDEINFEAQGISVAQALARSGGLLDSRSDPQGVFIFRMEPKTALAWPTQPVQTTTEGLVPVVLRIDLRNPKSFFLMQSLALNNHDILYVSNSPSAELQKFLNLIFSVVYPVVNVTQTIK